MIPDFHTHRDSSKTKAALELAIFTTGAIFVIELLGGFWTRSLALLSDSAHAFMDMVSFLISYGAILIAERPASDKHTFGWHRLEVFAAVINASTVFFIAISIFIHAIGRVKLPVEILSAQMLVIALVGLAVNLFVIWKLHPHKGTDLNVRSAFLHAIGDALASVAVVGGGLAVFLTGKHIIDALAAIAVSLIIVLGAYGILRDAFSILLERVPKNLDKNLLVHCIEDIAGQKSIQDLHIWNLCSHISALSLHLTLSEDQMRKQKEILENIQKAMLEKFNIAHTTVQIQSDQWIAKK